MKNYRIIKGRKISLKEIAARDRQFTVNNMPKIKPTFNKKNLSEIKFSENDVHFVQKAGEWKNTKHPQPKRIMKWKKRKYSNVKSYSKSPEMSVGTKFNKIKRNACNNFAWEIPASKPGFIRLFPNYPYTTKPLTKEAYWEKLVEHKLKKWEKKNPAPEKKEGELFAEEGVPYSVRLQEAEEKIREKVISMYHKLPLTARFKKADNKFNEVLVAELKDENGDGHHVNDLNPEKSKLLQKAQKITNEIHAKHSNLVCTNLRDHKRRTGRVILPEMRQAA